MTTDCVGISERRGLRLGMTNVYLCRLSPGGMPDQLWIWTPAFLDVDRHWIVIYM